MAYAGRRESLRDMARQLGVAYILEGSVRRAAGKVRVTGQLIRAASDEHIWAQDYDRDLTAANVFEIQSDLARKIAAALQAALSPREQKLLATRLTENTEAYELYLKSRGANLTTNFLRPTLESHEGFLRAAVALDPKFAAAWAELAVRHALFYYLNYDHTDARRAQAKSAIDTAVALAPDSPQVIRALGTYYLCAWRDYAQATVQFETLARAQPHDPETAAALGHVHQLRGRWTDALASYRQATELDPSNLGFSTTLMSLLYAGRRWDECETEGRRMRARHPQELEFGYWTSFISFARSGDTSVTDAFFAALTPEQSAQPVNVATRKFWLLLRGDYEGAIRLAQTHPVDPAQTQDQWAIVTGTAFAYAAKGDLPAAQKLVAEIAPTYRRRVVDEPGNTDVLWTLGLIEALLGRKEEALRLARSAVEAVPANLDAVSHAASLNRLVVIYAWAGEKDRAIEESARMLRMPFVGTSVHMMKRDPFWFPLRGDPRFEALLDDPKNNAPLF
jgi:tetratricopeptide (TPR) repeat protein